MISIFCPNCNKEFFDYASNHRKFCSQKCAGTMFKKNQIAWNKGKSHSIESRIKMSLSKIGKHYSPKTEFKKGQKSWNKGIHIRTNTGRTHFKSGEMIGSKHPNWKGGKTNHSSGYIEIRSSSLSSIEQKMFSPMFHKHTNSCLEHRIIVARVLNRPLSRIESVHHINGIKTDNRPENLYLFSKEHFHTKFHAHPYPLISNLTRQICT